MEGFRDRTANVFQWVNAILDSQHRAPIVEALLRHAQVERVSGHVPGHKAGRGFDEAWSAAARSLGLWDVTEVPGLDDLHRAEASIGRAQALAAEAWGADETHFLVGGGTVGNAVAVLTAVEADSVVIVARNCHQSVFNALEFARVGKVVAIAPEVRDGLVGSLSQDAVSDAISRFPEAGVLILTSPTYHGATSDVRAIVQIAHDHGMIVIVDEAHGAHLRFHSSLPPTATASQADLVVQSPHKMLAALTQTGLLHVNGSLVDRGRLRSFLRKLQSSSPSYLLLASLDLARRQMAVEGERLLTRAMSHLQAARERIAQSVGGIFSDGADGLWQDPFKWTLNARVLGMSGHELECALREDYGVYAEYADPAHVLLIWSFATDAADLGRLENALTQISRSSVKRESSGIEAIASPLALGESQVLQMPTEKERSRAQEGLLSDAIGRRVSEAIVVYPPGIPLALAGEVFTKHAFEAVARAMREGLRVDGVGQDEHASVRCLVD